MALVRAEWERPLVQALITFAEKAPELVGKLFFLPLLHTTGPAAMAAQVFFFVVCGLVALGAGAAIWKRAARDVHAHRGASTGWRARAGFRSGIFICIGVLLLGLGGISATRLVVRLEMQANRQRPEPVRDIAPEPLLPSQLRWPESPSHGLALDGREAAPAQEFVLPVGPAERRFLDGVHDDPVETIRRY